MECEKEYGMWNRSCYVIIEVMVIDFVVALAIVDANEYEFLRSQSFLFLYFW